MDKAKSEDHWHKRWHLKAQHWRRSPAWAEQYTFQHTEEGEEQLEKGNEEEGPVMVDRKTWKFVKSGHACQMLKRD